MKITEKQNITRIAIVIVLIAVIVLVSIFSHKQSRKAAAMNYDTTMLFNGTDLENWKIVLEDSLADQDSTFFVQNGHILTSGSPFGYVRTRDEYDNYNLLVEWRWISDPGNSGVFIHLQDDNIWPICLECQLMNQNAGDFVCFPGFDFTEHTDKEKWAVKKFEPSSENPAGEWNLYDIRTENDSVSIYVNGVLQNIATKTNYTKGHIALQSEGAPVEFRNVRIIRKSPVK